MEKAGLESRQVITLGQLGTARIRVQMGAVLATTYLKLGPEKMLLTLSCGRLWREKRRFKFVTLSGLAAGRIEGLCVSPEKQCSHAAYFTQYPRRADIYKGKDLFFFFQD